MDSLPLPFGLPSAAGTPLAADSLFTAIATDLPCTTAAASTPCRTAPLPGRLMPDTLLRTDAALATLLAAALLLVALWRWARHNASLLTDTALAIATGVAVALLMRFHAGHTWPVELFPVGEAALMGLYAAAAVAVLALQRTGYIVAHALFLSPQKRAAVRHHLHTAFAWQTLLLLLLVAVTMFFDLTPTEVLCGLALALLFVKILAIFKTLPFFFSEKYGVLHFFVYFCTLEAAPLLLLWSTLVELTNTLNAL